MMRAMYAQNTYGNKMATPLPYGAPSKRNTKKLDKKRPKLKRASRRRMIKKEEWHAKRDTHT